jgi:hypothetical protein
MMKNNTQIQKIKYRVKLEGVKNSIKEGFTDLKEVIAFVEGLKQNSNEYVIESYLDTTEPELLLETDDRPSSHPTDNPR